MAKEKERLKGLVLDGIHFKTLKVYCDYVGVNYDLISHMLALGERTMSDIHADVVEQKLFPKGHIVYDGLKFDTFDDLALYAGTSAFQVKSSLLLDLPLNESCYAPKQVRKHGIDYIDDIGVIVDGKLYTSLHDLCQHYGVDEAKVRYESSKDIFVFDVIKSMLDNKKKSKSQVKKVVKPVTPKPVSQKPKEGVATKVKKKAPKLEIPTPAKDVDLSSGNKPTGEFIFNGYTVPSLNWVLTYFNAYEYELDALLGKGMSLDLALKELMLGQKKGKKRRFIYDGRLIESSREFAEYIGISYTALDSRIMRGYSFDDIVTLKEKDSRVNAKDSYMRIKIGGIQFKNLQAMINVAKLDTREVAKLINEGYTKEQVYVHMFNKRTQGLQYVEVEGKKFSSFEAVASEYNLTLDDVKHSFMLGLPLNMPWHDPRALHYIGRKEISGIGVVVFGKYYPSVLDVTKEYDISDDALRSHLKGKVGLDVAIKTILDKRNKNTIHIVCEGETYTNIEDFAMDYSKSPDYIRHCLYRGMSPEQAVGLLPRPKSISVKIDPPMNYRGKVYSSYTVMAKDYNVKPVTFMGRLNSGWTLDQATGVAPKPSRKKKEKTK